VSEGSVHYYVYYRVDPEHASAAQSALKAVFAEVEGHCGISGRLMHRLDESLLWMEVYEGVRDCAAFEAALNRVLDSQRFGALLAPGATRVMERFVSGGRA
jgi:hypothetical protein